MVAVQRLCFDISKRVEYQILLLKEKWVDSNDYHTLLRITTSHSLLAAAATPYVFTGHPLLSIHPAFNQIDAAVTLSRTGFRGGICVRHDQAKYLIIIWSMKTDII